ncbi:hypothetical protein Gotur_035645 [Gossypium turneri]
MANEFLDKVEDNAIVRIWSEKVQLEKGDSLAKDYVSELWDYTRISVTQNSLQELKEIWDKWNDETKQLFYSNYGDLTYLLDVKVDEQLFRALAQYWNPAYSCFTFGEVDLVPTMKEYTALLHCPRLQVDKAYSRAAALGHVDEVVSDLFDRLGKGVTTVPAILAETFRSLNVYRRAGEGKFIEDVEWRAPWLIPDRILYRCGSFYWVPLLGIWGLIGYALLLVLRQYNSRQFVPATHGLAQCEFSYRGDNYKKKVKEISQAWNQVHRMKRLAVGSMTTPEYDEWRSKRINDNILELNSEGVRPMEEYLQVIPSELEIIKQDFEKRNLELKKKIERERIR